MALFDKFVSEESTGTSRQASALADIIEVTFRIARCSPSLIFF